MRYNALLTGACVLAAACAGARRDPSVPRNVPEYYTNIANGLSRRPPIDSVRSLMRANGFSCGSEREHVFSCERKTGKVLWTIPRWLVFTFTTDGAFLTNVESRRETRF